MTTLRALGRPVARRAAGAVPAYGVAALLVVGVVLTLGLPALASGYGDRGWVWWVHAPVAAAAFGAPSFLLLRHDPRTRIGQLLGLVAVLLVVADAAGAWAWLTLVGDPGAVPAGGAALWLASVVWLPAYFLLPTVLLLLTPDGHLPGPRWRPALWLSVAAIVLTTLSNATSPYHVGDGTDTVIPDLPADATNPLTSARIHHALAWSPALLVAACVLAVSAVLLRRRRAAGRERRQLDIVAAGALATVLLMVVGLLTPAPWFLLVVAVALTPYPVALGVAAARHRLWDLDLVLRRSVVYGTVAAAIVVAYVVIIAALGQLLGATTGAPLLATAVVAAGAAPLQRRVQRGVDRRLYGDRADPAAVLERLSRHLVAPQEPAHGQQVLAGLAGDIASSLRLPRVRIITATGVVADAGKRRHSELRFPLRNAGLVVGELVVAAREPGRPLTRRDEATVRQVADYVAVVVASLGLTAAARASQERSVVAREEERRRLRRDLHDGLGPQLAAIALQLETVRDLAGGGRTQAGHLAETLRTQTRDLVGEVRQIVDDLRPLVLDDLGLATSLTQQAQRFASDRMLVEINVGDLPELSAAAEVAVLRLVAEAVANAARHGEPHTCRVDVHRLDDLLELVVTDDGHGFDTGSAAEGVGLGSMRERAWELGGTCSVESSPGAGTTVRALLPGVDTKAGPDRPGGSHGGAS
jgi:signal transduction histidine kinase